MADIFNEHFREFIKALNDQQVDYILVGGMAVILHGYVRGTGDMDVWVNKRKLLPCRKSILSIWNAFI